MISTRKRVSYILFAWIAVAAFLLSTACTKSKSNRNTTVVNQQVPDDQVTPEVDHTGDEDDTKDVDKEEKQDDKNPIHLEPVPVDETDTGAPVETTPQDSIILDPRGMQPADIYKSSDAQGDSHVGSAADAEGGPSLFYSGSGQDHLHERIEMIAGRDEEDLALADSIGLATFEVDWASRMARATIPVTKSGGKVSKLTFTGKLSNSLRLIGGDLKRRGHIQLEAVCMDLAGGCQTVHMKLSKKMSEGKVATAHILARNSDAYLFIDGSEIGASQNYEYDRLMQSLLNTVYFKNETYNVVRSLRLWTSEVINAKSEFSVVMKIGQSLEPLVIRGALVKPETGTNMNLVLDSVPTKISSTFRETHLTRNDGRGNLQFDITIRKGTEQASEDTIRLTIARIHADVRNLILK